MAAGAVRAHELIIADSVLGLQSTGWGNAWCFLGACAIIK
jgi:hypothetical protein